MKLLSRSLLFIFLFAAQASAESIIRDAEIEGLLRDVSNPIFQAAKLSPNSIKIYIVNNPEINAYVAGGNNIFINTGLLEISENPNIITGVIAHETGHISGGHLLRSSEEAQNTTIKTTLGYMVGLAAAAAGSPQAGMAIVSGAGQVAQRQMLKFTRTHEESADQAALTYLDKTGQSARGLLELLEVLYSKETALYGNTNPYILTHPLSKERIAHVKAHIASSKYSDVPVPQAKLEAFKLGITKLNAFLQPSDKTLRKYPASDTSINARYARAIAYYKIPDMSKSLAEIDSLIAAQPQNPFFYELKGQILFENGRIKESIPCYAKAVELLPSSALLKIILATAQISSEDETMRVKAIKNIESALAKEKDNAFAWNQLAIAYGRGNDLGMSNLALAEEASLNGNKKGVRQFLEAAKPHIKAGSPAELRMKDMLSAVESDKKGK
jgi:predicted Zn-dependent protease